jgi:hypothetical protein
MAMTLKEQIDGLAAQVAAKEADIGALKAAHESAIAALKAEHVAALDKGKADIEAALKERDASEASVAHMKLDLDKLAGELAQANAARASAEAKLANPAFEHASAAGIPAVKEVNTESGIETPEQFQAKYDAESDPAKRTAMWQARQVRLGKKD